MLSKQKTLVAALSTAVIAFAATTGSALAQKKYDTAIATPRSSSATSCPYSGSASAYGVIGKISEYFKMINEQARHQRPQDHFHQL